MANSFDQIKVYLSNRKWFILLLLIFCLYGTYSIIIGKRDEKFIRTNGRYVIGEIVATSASRGGNIADYTFYFDGIPIRHRTTHDFGRQYIGKKFLVVVLPYPPYNSRILDSFNIPDNLQLKQPDSGWVENPFNHK